MTNPISDSRIRELATQAAEREAAQAVRRIANGDVYEVVANAPELRGWSYLQRKPFATQVADIAKRATVAIRLQDAGEPDEFPTVTICGSMRFFPRMLDVAREMTAAGRIVLMPFDASLTGIANKTATEHGAMLDAMHRQKIRMSGLVYVVNPGGYIGESTRSEIEYATGLGLPVEYDDTPEGD